MKAGANRYWMRTTVSVLSFELPELLNSIFPFTVLESFTDILMLAAGLVITPLSDT